MTASPTVVLLSGLGADQRVFRHWPLHQVHHQILDWIPPKKGESLPAYALRMADRIDAQGPVFLVGVSFGGMLAVEIAHHRPVAGTMLISTAKGRPEFRQIFRWPWMGKLFRRVPRLFWVPPAWFLDWLFSPLSPEEKTLIREILKDTDPAFVRWAMEAIVRWDRKEWEVPMLHIHGQKDLLLPYQRIKTTHLVPEAGHFLVHSHPDYLYDLLQQMIDAYE